jgi:hypothetical protein
MLYVAFRLFSVGVILMPALSVAVPASADKALNLTFCCAPDNDLYVALRQSGYRCRRYTTAAEAINKATSSSGVLLLAEGYPERRTVVEPILLDRAEQKHLKLYIEFPQALPKVNMEPVQQSLWERVVVTSNAFGAALPRHGLLMAHDCRFIPVQGQTSLLALARMAGFDTAIYGLPEQIYPLLSELPDRQMLIATTKLSAFRRGRYAPTQEWQTVWAHILAKLDPHANPVALIGKPDVHPAYTATEKLTQESERRAFREGVAWYRHSRLLLSASRHAEIEALLRANKATVPLPQTETAKGDGTYGILEGYASTIKQDGTQEQLTALRADCNAETAMVFALDYAVNKSKGSGDIARRLLDYTFSTMHSGVRANPKHPAFGLIAWGAFAPAWEVANYGDDNARTLLSALIAVTCLNTDRWDAALLQALLANLRTTGKLGFRGDRIDIPDLEKHGWRHYSEASPVNYSPHFESYLWACYLWAYQQTGHRPFLEPTKTAIRMTMEAYPQKWRWQDTMERARMLLCLSWLVRLEDTAEHRQWLKMDLPRFRVGVVKQVSASLAL